MSYKSAGPELSELFRNPSADHSALFTTRIGATPRQIRPALCPGASGVAFTASVG